LIATSLRQDLENVEGGENDAVLDAPLLAEALRLIGSAQGFKDVAKPSALCSRT
jgi:hypothetical protein